MISIKNLYGKGDIGDLKICGVSLCFHFFSNSGFHWSPCISIGIRNVSFIMGEAKLQSKPKKKKTLEKWFLHRLFLLFISIFFKEFRISLDSLSFVSKDLVSDLKSIKLDVVRNAEQIYAEFRLDELVFTRNGPFLRIPSINIVSHSTLPTLTYLLRYCFDSAFIKSTVVSFLYDSGCVSLKDCVFEGGIQGDEDVQVRVLIKNFDAFVPEFDITTKSLSISLYDLYLTKNTIESAQFVSLRNNISLMSFSSFIFSNNMLTVEGLNVFISTPFLIDFGLLKRFFIGNKHTQEKNKSRSFQKLRISAPKAEIKLALSDNHVILLSLKRSVISNMTIISKRILLDVLFPNETYHLLIGHYFEMNFMRPLFDVKLRSADFTLHSTFAEQSFLSEFFSIISFMSKQIKGDIASMRDNQPPLRRLFSFNINKATISFVVNDLVDSIIRQNEAKRVAMNALTIRQDKAVQILKANPKSGFSEETFYRESRRILFDLYKNATKSLPPLQKEVFSLEFSELELIWNGPAYPNRKAAIEKLLNISENLVENEIGKITGGAFSISSKSLAFSWRHIGQLLYLTNLKTGGCLFKVKKSGEKQKDYFLYQIECDNGNVCYNIPAIASPSVYFFDEDVSIDSLDIKISPSMKEIKQDFKLALRIFRRKKFLFRRVRFFDYLRLRMKTRFSMNIKTLKLEINDTNTQFTKFALFEVVVPNMSFRYNGDCFVFSSQNIALKSINDLSFRQFLVLPNPKLTFQFISTNPFSTGNSPIFIFVDSSRVADPTYFPYEKYCTHTYSLQCNLQFGDGNIVFNLDNALPLIERIIAKPASYNRFISPPAFLPKPFPYPTFSHIDFSTEIPKVIIIMQQGRTVFRLSGDPMKLWINSKDHLSLKIECNEYLINGFFNENPMLTLILNQLNVQKGFHTTASISYFRIKMNHQFVNSIEIPKIHIPMKKPKSGVIEYIPFDCIDSYSNSIASLTIGTFELRVLFDEHNSELGLVINSFVFEHALDDDGKKVFKYSSNNISTFINNNVPFLTIYTPSLFMFSPEFILLFDTNAISLEINPYDYEFASYLKQLYPSTSNQIPKSEKAQKFKCMHANIKTLLLNVRNQENRILVNSEASLFSFKFKSSPNGEMVLSTVIKSISVKDETCSLPFRDIFVPMSQTEQPILSFFAKKASNVMKCPVYEKIDIKLSPFILSISMPFIKHLISVFPSAEDLRALDLDTDDAFESPDNVSSYENINDSIQQNPTDIDKAVFCQEFIFHPFRSELNFRRKDQGVFSEFIGKPFEYKGLHFYDIYGSRKQITTYMKKNLKWTAIKALPSFLLGKSRASSTQQQLPKPQDIHFS